MAGSHEVAGSSPAGSTSKGPLFAGLFPIRRQNVTSTPEELRARIEGILDRRGPKHVGLVVGVRWLGQTTVVGRGRVADDRPQAPDERTIFEIGSITKVVTATLLADMAREGLVALDDPVQRYLPDDPRITGEPPRALGRARLDDPARGRPARLRALARRRHRGLP